MPTNILVAVPAFGQMISATTFLTICGLQQALNQKGIGGGVSSLSFPDIAELRSMYLTIMYDTMPNTSHICFVDADMGFAPDLVLDMLLLDEPVVGAVYPQRRLPQSWAGSGTGAPQAERRGNFMHVEGVGMGCTLIRRDAVKIMVEKFPEMCDTRLSMHPAGETMKAAGATRLIRLFEKIDIPERGVVSEDLSFCIRWNQCGGKVWASIGHRISHVGPYDYAGRYLDQFENPQHQAAIAGAMPQAQAAAVPVPEIQVQLAPQNFTATIDPAAVIGEAPQVLAAPAAPEPPAPVAARKPISNARKRQQPLKVAAE